MIVQERIVSPSGEFHVSHSPANANGSPDFRWMYADLGGPCCRHEASARIRQRRYAARNAGFRQHLPCVDHSVADGRVFGPRWISPTRGSQVVLTGVRHDGDRLRRRDVVAGVIAAGSSGIARERLSKLLEIAPQNRPHIISPPHPPPGFASVACCACGERSSPVRTRAGGGSCR